MKSSRLLHLVLTLVPSLLLCGWAMPASAQFYANKRVEIIIPTSPGGGTDLFARLLADGFGQFLEGRPTIVPRQMTAGGGLVAGNWVVEQAPKDGTVLLASTGQTALRHILGQRGLRTEWDDFEVLVAIPMTRNVFVAANKGMTSRLDLPRLSEGDGLFTALIDPISGISFMLQAGMTNMPLRVIKGFEGGKDRDLAMLRGEIDIIQQISLQYDATSRLFLNRGAIHLWNDGLLDANGNIVRDNGFPDIPTFPEAYEQAYGVPPDGMLYEAYKAIIPLIGNAGKIVLISKDVPEPGKAALRQAVERMAADVRFTQRVINENRGYGLLYGAELEAALRVSHDMSPELIAFLRDYISASYEIEFE